MKSNHPIQSISFAAALFLFAFSLQAAPPPPPVPPNTLPTTPLYLAGGVAPNLVVTLDDSGSMAWAYVPDSMGKNAVVEEECKSGGTKNHDIFYDYDGAETKRYFLSGSYNAQYYNPSISYLAPLKADKTPFLTSFKAAYSNGFNTGSAQIDLSTAYQPTFGFQPKSNECYTQHPSIDTGPEASKKFTGSEVKAAAYYYVFKSGGAGCTGASISTTNEACYAHTAVLATEQQNFANWYSFYRTRNLTTVTAATRAFNNLPSTMRFAWQALNPSCDDFSGTSCKGWDGVSKDNRIRTLNTTHKQNFYDWLVKLPANGGTPLRAGLGRVGEYFSIASTTELNSPYAEDPQVTAGTQHSCRANYTIMMTDGIWNGGAAGNTNADDENVDGSARTLPDGIAYKAAPPYQDTHSGSLADVAFYYWANDLRTDLTNNVVRSPSSFDKLVEDKKPIPPADYFDPKNDPASWQHMVTYTVGLGLTTTFPTLTPSLTWAGDTYKGSYDYLASGALTWPAIGANKPGNVADLWHAALNGRGLFFSAEDPKTLSDGMQEIVSNILGRISSAASLATNSKQLDTGTTIYQASFDSGNWTGQLEAIELISEKGPLEGTLGKTYWSASTKIPASRIIKTFNVTGVDFAWLKISTAQQTALGSIDVLNYLRGDQTKEENKGGAFRTRSSLLGDIINSDPLLVSTENYGYDKMTGNSGAEGTGYVTYLAGKSSKPPVIYVGANDGMLHGFNAIMGWQDTDLSADSDGDGSKTNDKNLSVATADSGKELFAYVPALVYAQLPELSKPGYELAHKYFVDGAPTAGDVYYGGTAWKTVLITPLGAGGRGVFALDITKDFSTSAFANTDVLWEFNGTSAKSTPSDMGYPVGAVAIGRFNDGNYYAVFGNGYGSANCKSGLFMVQIDKPSNVQYWDTGTGTCVSSTTQNGMSTPSLVDYGGDRIIDAIFAGDLQGNLWKFDVSKTAWGIALAGKPMFTTAVDQPITAPVEIGPAPSGSSGKAMVYFGTGRYLFSGDQLSKTKQAFYGLLDNDTVVTSGKLITQDIVFENETARVVSTKSVDWTTKQGWALNLVPPSGTAQGERVLSVPLLRYGRVIFNTSIPSADPCVLGGTGWLMELDAATGGNLPYSALDINGDGSFDEKDNVSYTDANGKVVSSPVGGKKSGSMSLNQPIVITAGAKEYKLTADIKKGISIVTEKAGTKNPRSSWRQLQ